MMRQKLTPARIITPGQIILRELAARGWTQTDLAKMIAQPQQTISKIMNGTLPITPELSSALAAAFGTSDEFWHNLETNYRSHLAQQQAKFPTQQPVS